MTNISLKCISQYITMRDGVRLAVSIWSSEDAHRLELRVPAILVTTRYWRALSFKQDMPEAQPYYALAESLCANDYALVVADARGSGASFGFRDTELTHDEVVDIGETIDWVARQRWCDGRVATVGTSYSANTALRSLVTAPKTLKGVVCRAPDFDLYRHLLAPGGVVNHWFIEVWGRATAAQDRNNVAALYADGYWVPPNEAVENVLGVRAIDEDIDFEYGAGDSLLAAAIEEHHDNFQLDSSRDSFDYIENEFFNAHHPIFDPIYQRAIEDSRLPLVIRCGWHDAGTSLGALCMYASFQCPLHVILGPWNHEGSYHVDPMDNSDGIIPEPFDIIEARVSCLSSLDGFLKRTQLEKTKCVEPLPFRRIEYYTLGEGRWKKTQDWPLAQTTMERWYLDGQHQLSKCRPISEKGSDIYQVDSSARTGRHNRWHAQSPSQPILFPDRHNEDKKLLVYDTPPFEQAVEITGHPVISLNVSSSATDGQFFVYLETIDPDGRVRLLTEGQLRGIHRKVSNEAAPYKMFGPYHSFKKKDAHPLVPGEITEITFDLFPISILLPKGQRVRVAIAGADADVFAPIEGCESPEIVVERNSVYSSYIDLPII